MKLNKIINISSIIFVSGILLDIVTTFIGMKLGYGEKNIFGFNGVFIVNGIILILYPFVHKKMKKVKAKKTAIVFMLIGIFRLLVGLNNIKILINK